jgi:uncharacterized protein YneF (UPF0154 family)
MRARLAFVLWVLAFILGILLYMLLMLLIRTCLSLTITDQKIYKSTPINKKSVKMIAQSKSFADFGVSYCGLGEHSILFPRSCRST